MRCSAILTALLWTVFGLIPVHAQDSGSTVSRTCTFADGKQISVRYRSVQAGKKEGPPTGQVWKPGDTHIYLFTQADLLLGDTLIPTGAYAMYLLADKETWTLILNKNVTEGSSYQQQQDLLRVPMQMGQLSKPAGFKVSFGHIGPKQCNMRIYYGKAGSWAEFKEK